MANLGASVGLIGHPGVSSNGREADTSFRIRHFQLSKGLSGGVLVEGKFIIVGITSGECSEATMEKSLGVMRDFVTNSPADVRDKIFELVEAVEAASRCFLVFVICLLKFGLSFRK